MYYARQEAATLAVNCGGKVVILTGYQHMEKHCDAAAVDLHQEQPRYSTIFVELVKRSMQ